MVTIVSVEEYNAFANITGVKLNTQISSLLLSATSTALQYIGLDIREGEFTTKVYTEKDRQKYFLNSISAISSVSIINRYTKETLLLVEDIDYYFYDDAFILIDILPNDLDILTFNISAAGLDTYGNVIVASEIKLAIMLLTQYYYKGEYNKTSISSAGQQVNLSEASGLPKHIRALLDFHRIL